MENGLVAILNKVVRAGLLEKVTFEQRLREVSGISLAERTARAKALRQEPAWCV